MRNNKNVSGHRGQDLSRYAWICAVLLGVFALYAPSLRLTTLFDDAYIINVIGGRGLLSVFDLKPYGALVYRPMSYVPWLLVRDIFGWFRPDILHFLNISAHIINMALLAGLATRMGHVWHLKGVTFPALAALIFGLFPFSFQAVLWPSALPHPLMSVYGMAGVHAYLTARSSRRKRNQIVWLFVSAILLLAACLCHEQGFIFGIMTVLLECTLVWHERKKIFWPAFVLAMFTFAYALFIKYLGNTMWTDPSATMLAIGPSDWITSLAFHAQGMLAWFFILFRNLIGLPQEKTTILICLLVLNTLGVLGLLYWLKRLTLGLLSLAWWVIAIAPSVLLLSQYYVLSGPRLMYVAALGIALVYAGLVAAFFSTARLSLLKAVILAVIIFMSVWCVPYIMERTNVTARLTTSLKSIDQDLRTSSPDAKVLLIDLPGWMSTNNPAFLLGSEGMLFFQDSMVSPTTMVASVGNTWRETVHVRDLPSPAYGGNYIYGVAGPMTEGEDLKTKVLKANFVYRFYFDTPGLRVQRLATLLPATDISDPLARISKGTASVVLEKAQALQCQGTVMLDLTWSHASTIQEPVAIFVHGMDASGQQVAVADRDLVGGILPLNELSANIKLNERRVLTTTNVLLSITKIQVGVYSRNDGLRYQATRADGSLWEGESVTIPVDTTEKTAACRDIAPAQ
jgi:hypothetical protein